AFLSSLTNRNYTATQYALFSSLMTLPGKFVSGFSGWVVDGWGYAEFFVVASLLGLPAIVLVLWLMRRNDAALLPPSSDQSQA
ncbi:MAG: AmpG family muropeptide MFS transporter, partial [Oceanospirillaceae bacterium]|nr:AmpG family muropeptide MFS transporter [Oceanospirillaceae bacterium]